MIPKPYSPKEALAAKVIPPEVLEVVNEMLAEQFSGTGSVNLLSAEVVQRVKGKNGGRDLPPGALDFEDAYRKRGWTVVYDRPAYNESYGAHWTFTPDDHG